MRLPKPPRLHDPRGGRPPKHEPEFRFAKPETWPEPPSSPAPPRRTTARRSRRRGTGSTHG
ncbi:hypothetical protein ABT236_30705 [Streptomyces sp. NPDC001523]|uniref:hypothetical protein n=1 Tax=Streptomyces sp. NPDC001523 TaxID=3154383 RepID=UPI0033168906